MNKACKNIFSPIAVSSLLVYLSTVLFYFVFSPLEVRLPQPHVHTTL